ncbi:MAG: MarR family transcriptional regulator [Methanomicrobiales archaeon]|nr:MarR family transcriptional regulator [Methanomicrobiales archaeon]
MNEEDLDWLVYHHLLDDPCQGVETLAGKTGCSTTEIGESLRRLEKSMLISQDADGCRVLSVQEVLLQCQSRYDPHAPFTIEGGVIRMKKGPD